MIITGTGLTNVMQVQGSGVDIAHNSSALSTLSGTDYGAVYSAAPVTRTFTIRNTGTGPLGLTGAPKVTFTGTHTADFSLVTAPTSPVSAAGGETTFDVRFTPTGTGSRSATVVIANTDTARNPYQFAIGGTGTAPDIGIESPAGTALATGSTSYLGWMKVNNAPISRTFTLKNTGSAELTGLAATFTGPDTAFFSLTTPPPTTLAVGATSTFTVSFSASVTGARTAVLQVASNDPDENPYLINLRASAHLQTFTDYDRARMVLGQVDMNSRVGGSGPVVTGVTSAVAVSVNGVVAVADQELSRVTLWPTMPEINGAPASIVLGHPNFTMTGYFATPEGLGLPGGVALSPDGQKLLVADTANNRVLIWNTLPTTNGQQADLVLGQPNLTTLTFAITATGLKQPKSVTVAADGRVVVADTGNHRVLIYSAIPGSNGVAAVRVIGQTTFTSGALSGTSASKLSSPSHAFITPDGRLIVTDTGNNRVLIWNTVPVTNGASADLVIGQVDFISNGVGGISAARLNLPSGAALSATGQLAIGDAGYHRVLLFDGLPTSNGAAANYVLGQPDFISSVADNDLPTISDRSMNQPSIPTFSPDGRLWVPGHTMRRVMVFGSQFAADHLINITAGVLRVRVMLSETNTLTINEPTPGFIQFGSALHDFAFADNIPTEEVSEAIPLAGVTRIEIEGGVSDETIEFGHFTTPGFPSLAVHGGTGNDTFTANGSITFAADANLDLDLSNDSPTPGSDVIRFLSGDYLLSGTGTALLRVTGGIAFEIDSGLVTQNGDLTVEGNRQATQGTATMDGVRVYRAQIASTGNGQVTVRGRGGPTNSYSGVGVYDGGEISGGLTGTLLVDGIGGTSGSGVNVGGPITSSQGAITVTGTGRNGITLNSEITSTGPGLLTVTGVGGVRGINMGGAIAATGGGSVIVHGTGGSLSGSGVATLRHTGVTIQAGQITATGGGHVTVTGIAGSSPGDNNSGVELNNAAVISSENGHVQVTGTGGTGGASNYGVSVLFGGSIYSSGIGNVAVTGTGGTGTSLGNSGVGLIGDDDNVRVYAAGGSVSITGTGGSGFLTGGVDGPMGLNYGIYFSGAKIEAASGVSIFGTGGTLGNNNYGVFIGRSLHPRWTATHQHGSPAPAA